MEKAFINNKQFDRNNLPKVSVIDAPCGTGKTTAIINKINSSNNPIVFCTPFISEVTRIGNECDGVIALDDSKEFKATFKGTKIDTAKQLLSEGKSISISHELFKLFDEECYGYIKHHGYSLYLDEVITSVENFGIKPSDINWMLERKAITVLKDTKEVVWLEDDYDGVHNPIMKAIKAGDVYLCDISDKKQLLVWELSICKFIFFKEVTLLTYLFEGSELSCFFKINHIPYTLYSMQGYEVVPYDKHLENREALKELINVYDGKANSNFRGTLSASFYKNKRNAKEVTQLKKNSESYFKNTVKATSKNSMWSCYSSEINSLKSTRCTKNNHVPFNSRATNDYRDKTNLAYLINVFCDPDILHYFNSYNIDLDQDLYAVSTLIQWVCRSAVRDGKPVNLYLPSQRMRDLLDKFFNYEI